MFFSIYLCTLDDLLINSIAFVYVYCGLSCIFSVLISTYCYFSLWTNVSAKILFAFQSHLWFATAVCVLHFKLLHYRL